GIAALIPCQPSSSMGKCRRIYCKRPLEQRRNFYHGRSSAHCFLRALIGGLHSKLKRRKVGFATFGLGFDFPKKEDGVVVIQFPGIAEDRSFELRRFNAPL